MSLIVLYAAMIATVPDVHYLKLDDISTVDNITLLKFSHINAFTELIGSRFYVYVSSALFDEYLEEARTALRSKHEQLCECYRKEKFGDEKVNM